MSAKDFSRSLARVLVYEGGKVDDPRDPGGRTAYGITQRVYDAWRKTKRQKPKDVYSITQAERSEIYKVRYWDVISGDKLPSGVDFVVFDGAVNSGTAQAVKWLQRALGSLYTGTVDGQMGILTLAACKAHPDPRELVSVICERRLYFLQHLRTWGTYGRGWKRRVDAVRETGMAWASEAEAPALVDAQPTPKAPITDAVAAPPRAPGDIAAGVGGAGTATAGTGISGILDSAKSQLEPFGGLGFISKILLGLTMLSILLLVGGVSWRWYAARKTNQQRDALDLNTVTVNAVIPT